MARPEGQLERSLHELTISVHTAGRLRARALSDSQQGERTQTIHLTFSGVAQIVWGFADQVVRWEQPILYAPLQRQVTYKTPHFGKGFEVVGSTATPLLFDAHVLSWITNEAGWFLGANVRLGACAPQGIATAYTAIAHLEFQGYSTYAEEGEFDNG